MAKLRLLALLLICILASLYASIRMLYVIFKNENKAWVMAIAFDQLANAAANGDPDETISSRGFRAQKENKNWGCILCKILNFIDKEHCPKAEGI